MDDNNRLIAIGSNQQGREEKKNTMRYRSLHVACRGTGSDHNAGERWTALPDLEGRVSGGYSVATLVVAGSRNNATRSGLALTEKWYNIVEFL